MPSHRFISAGAIGLSAITIAACGSGDDGGQLSADASGTQTQSTAASVSTAGKGRRIRLTARDMAFSAKQLRARAGKLTISLKNTGAMEHELVLIRTTTAADKLPVKDGRASERGSVGEIEDVGGGQTKARTFKLRRGRYVFICNVPGHYAAGMRGVLVVR